MIFRRLLLGVGALALMAGVVLALLWLKSPSPTVVEKAGPPPQSLLVAAHALPAGTLLRADDLRWVQVSVSDVPPGAFLRNQTGDTEPLGAATRRSFRAGEALVSDQLIKPTEAGFLPAVLAPGMRATSIAVDAAEGGAGLIAPGDRVDVILTQSFTDTNISVTSRSVGETILQNLRVIAIDQTTNLTGNPGPGVTRTGVVGETRLPKTVTLEVSVRQAEVLMVAGQLGKLQLTLRSLADASQPGDLAVPAPTWAVQVSPALRSLVPLSTPTPATVGATTPRTPIAIEIIRGSKDERNCYSQQTGQPADCAPGPTPAEPRPSATAPDPVRSPRLGS